MSDRADEAQALPPRVPSRVPAATDPVTPAGALRALVRPVRRRMIVSAAWAALAGSAGVLGLLAVAGVLGELLEPRPDGDRIARLVGIALSGALLRFLLRWWSIRVSHLAAFDFEASVRADLIAQLGRIPLGEIDRLGAAAFKKIALDDVRDLHAAVGDIPPLLGFAVAGPITATAVLIVVDWRLAACALLLAPAAWVALRLGLREDGEMRQAYNAANEAINKAVVELVQGLPVVRMFDDGSVITDRFRTSVDAFTRALGQRNYTGRTATILTQLFVVSLPTLLVILVAGTALLNGDALSRADLLVFLVLGTVAIDTVHPVLWLTHLVRESISGAVQVRRVLQIPPLPEPVEATPPADGAVRLRGVGFSYDDERAVPALNGINLDVPHGTVCALVGPSGAGKSTVARLIGRFWDVDAGSIEIGGVDVREIGTQELLRTVALVFQDPFLTCDTVRENVRMSCATATDDAVERAARAADAHDFIVNELPHGYDTVVGERGDRLSGGQRQRIAIARALLSKARVVILDEATAFADPESEATIQLALARLRRGRTVLVVAHRLRTIIDADQIAVLDGGRIVERGDHASLLLADGRYADLWRHHLTASAWGLGGAP